MFSEFINKFKENIKDIYFAPKIIIFTKEGKSFLEYNVDYNNNENKFYTFGGIATKIDKIKVFLSKINNYNINNDLFLKSQNIKNDLNNKNISIISINISYKKNEIKNDSDVQLTFEYIDSKEKLS